MMPSLERWTRALLGLGSVGVDSTLSNSLGEGSFFVCTSTMTSIFLSLLRALVQVHLLPFSLKLGAKIGI